MHLCEGEVICDHLKVRSCATLRGKAMCDLRVQVAHEGSSYIECACGVGVELIGLDMMSSAELNTW